jgi:hypothetical protein
VILIDGGDGEQSQHEPMAPVFKLPLLLKELSGQFYCGGRDGLENEPLAAHIWGTMASEPR